jgi:hypothetical protein
MRRPCGEPSIWTITAVWANDSRFRQPGALGDGTHASAAPHPPCGRPSPRRQVSPGKRRRCRGKLRQSRGGRARRAEGDWGPIFEMYNKQMERVDISANHQLSELRRAFLLDVGPLDTTAAAAVVGDWCGFKTWMTPTAWLGAWPCGGQAFPTIPRGFGLAGSYAGAWARTGSSCVDSEAAVPSSRD